MKRLVNCRSALPLVAALLATLASADAAALTQPDGTVIPVHPGSNNLWDMFASLGEPIDPVADAADVPETFDPTCNLTFTLVTRGGAAFQNVFGWYNVTGQKPPTNDLHVLLDCNAQPGQAFPLAIKNDPNYKGGKIGFFLITPQNQPSYCASTNNIGYVYYSEKSFNPDNMGPNNSYIHLLIYDSKVKSKAYYFAWEDLFGGGDNEFTDFVGRVDGINCANGGGACQTGKPGVCGAGTLECQNGVLTCVQTFQPSPEKCDAIDNDCNGQVDDGGHLCDPGYVCDKGNCVPECGKEIQCTGTAVCDSGYCVDPKCAMVKCDSGKKCVAGKCVGPCDGVKCPHGQVCSVGVCLDPCKAITCDPDQVCVAGACLEKCQCAGCPMGQACQPDGRCIDAACAMVSCKPGTYCDPSGQCVDDCKGAQCPMGEVCSMGSCVASMTSGAGGGGQGGGSISIGAGGDASGSTSSGVGGQSTGSGNGVTEGPAKKSGCACALEDGDGDGAALFAIGAALAAIATRRGGSARARKPKLR